jgi:hypothetical protein
LHLRCSIRPNLLSVCKPFKAKPVNAARLAAKPTKAPAAVAGSISEQNDLEILLKQSKIEGEDVRGIAIAKIYYSLDKAVLGSNASSTAWCTEPLNSLAKPQG